MSTTLFGFKNIKRLPAKRVFVLSAIFIILAIVRVTAIYEHDELIADETFSLMLAQHNDAYVAPLPSDTTLSGRQIKQMLIAEHPLTQDIGALYVNNRDIPHASLYYMALRLSVQGMTTYDSAELAQRGGWLNMLFFTISFLALCALVKVIFGHRRNMTFLTAACVCVAFAGSCAIECTLLVREYQMAQMFIVLMCLALAWIADNMRRDKIITYRLWLGLTVTTAGILSTGYLNALIVFMLFAWICIAALCHKRFTDLLRIVIAAIASLALAWSIYIGFFNFLRFSTIHTQYSFSSYGNIPYLVFNKCLMQGVVTPWGLLFIIVLLVTALIGRYRRMLIRPLYMPWIPVLAVVAMLMTEYASVLHALRYIFPLIPLVALVVPLICNALSRRMAVTCSSLLCAYLLVVAIAVPVRPKYDWQTIGKTLEHGATLYRLNPNELPQVAPMLNPEACYHLTDTLTNESVRPIVARIRPDLTPMPESKPLTGPLHVYGK